MRLWFCLGTAAELIKIYPVIVEADRRGFDWYFISTGQSGVNLWRQYDDFKLPRHRVIHLEESKSDLSSSVRALIWFFSIVFTSKSKIISILKRATGYLPEKEDFWFVHGDTLSTLLGTIIGRRLSVPVVHVEAGMRSHNIFSPFPEELSRRLVSRLANYHMAPDDNAKANLISEGIYENVFITKGNSVRDALFEALPTDLGAAKEPYVLANIHRFENLQSDKRWRKIIETILRVSSTKKVILILMPSTVAKLEQDQKTRELLAEAGVDLVKRLPFREFVHLLARAEFVLTDGGSNQQECYYLGKPCLILREVTESLEGLESGICVLSELKDEIIENFLSNPPATRPVKKGDSINDRPTDLIFKALDL